MTFTGSIWTQLSTPNVDGGNAKKLRAEDITEVDNVNYQYEATPSVSSYPNGYVDHLGINNRIWTLKGTIDLTETSSDELTLGWAGSFLSDTGSALFTDEAFAQDGVYVQVVEFKPRRRNTYGQASYRMGHIIQYTMKLVETL